MTKEGGFGALFGQDAPLYLIKDLSTSDAPVREYARQSGVVVSKTSPRADEPLWRARAGTRASVHALREIRDEFGQSLADRVELALLEMVKNFTTHARGTVGLRAIRADIGDDPYLLLEVSAEGPGFDPRGLLSAQHKRQAVFGEIKEDYERRIGGFGDAVMNTHTDIYGYSTNPQDPTHKTDGRAGYLGFKLTTDETATSRRRRVLEERIEETLRTPFKGNVADRPSSYGDGCVYRAVIEGQDDIAEFWARCDATVGGPILKAIEEHFADDHAAEMHMGIAEVVINANEHGLNRTPGAYKRLEIAIYSLPESDTSTTGYVRIRTNGTPWDPTQAERADPNDLGYTVPSKPNGRKKGRGMKFLKMFADYGAYTHDGTGMDLVFRPLKRAA